VIKNMLLIICAGLAACTVLPERAQVNLYQLPPSSRVPTGAEQFSGLRLARPGSSDALGGRLLLMMTDEQSYQAYPDARWTASIPVLWRDWLLDALWRDGRITELSTDSDRLQASVELGGMLRRFHTEYNAGRPEAVITYDARLVGINSRQILASRRFESSEPVSGAAAAAAVNALGVAADRLAEELTGWLLERLDAEDGHAGMRAEP